MAAILDVIYSIILGGILLLTVVDANKIANETYSKYNGDMLVQELLVSTAQMLEGEVRNMGYGVPQEVAPVVYADTNRIRFLVDLGRNGGAIDTVTYYVGPTSELTKTMNDQDRYLYRSVNTSAAIKVGVVTLLRFRYMTADGYQLPTPVSSGSLSEVFIVEITMEVQNPYAELRNSKQVKQGQRNANYSSSLWQQTRLASQNTRR